MDSLDDFFNFDQESKCKTCFITKKGLKVETKKDLFEIERKGNPEIAIILEFPEPFQMMSMFKNFINTMLELKNVKRKLNRFFNFATHQIAITPVEGINHSAITDTSASPEVPS